MRKEDVGLLPGFRGNSIFKLGRRGCEKVCGSFLNTDKKSYVVSTSSYQ